jgi:type I restriction enzyme M protein
MLTGELRSQVDAIWNAFWSGGIANPIEVIEQITYLLFQRRLDDLHTLEENKAIRLGKPDRAPHLPAGRRRQGPRLPGPALVALQELRAGRDVHRGGRACVPLPAQPGRRRQHLCHHMKDARFTIPTPALLAKVVDMLDHVPMDDRDTKGDLYEYMLGKIAAPARTASSARRATSSG